MLPPTLKWHVIKCYQNMCNLKAGTCFIFFKSTHGRLLNPQDSSVQLCCVWASSHVISEILNTSKQISKSRIAEIVQEQSLFLDRPRIKRIGQDRLRISKWSVGFKTGCLLSPWMGQRISKFSNDTIGGYERVFQHRLFNSTIFGGSVSQPL